MTVLFRFFIAIYVCVLAGCSVSPSTVTQNPETESDRLNRWFEDQWQVMLARSPEFQTSLGMKSNNHLWDNESTKFRKESHQLRVDSLDEMRREFDFEKLSPDAQLSYRLYEYNVELSKKRFPFDDYWYVFSQFRGPHSTTPAFLVNNHRIDNAQDAKAYIKRLRGLKDHFAQYEKRARAQFDHGITLPNWSYGQMIGTSQNAITGAPFDDGRDNTIFADFKRKVGSLDLPSSARESLIEDAESAMLSSVKPAYGSLIAMFEEHQSKASSDDGAWKFPDGDKYYNIMLEVMTSTQLDASTIHELGLSEVARIHKEMNEIRESVGFEGSLQGFFVYMRNDPDNRFTYPNTPEGKQAYLDDATAIIDTMRSRLDELFFIKPKADFTVKAVEPFREKAAGKAFYSRPAADGSRPGIYYANLYNTANMPKYQMEALAYHEGIPGHHMQIAIQQELAGLPKFRRFGRVTAYSEGWGLYTEYLPKEMGFYADPYSDFGRLAMELWRAARLVVDTGLHEKRWTREEAIQYLLDNTPNPKGDCVKAIERYVVMPGQATAYKIGMMKILELREDAKRRLGDKFDIRGFHDTVLANGPVPLSILESLVDQWVASQL
ncbi:MAG: DUF885 domain-containing protein [Pseudomonadota bacterium]